MPISPSFLSYEDLFKLSKELAEATSKRIQEEEKAKRELEAQKWENLLRQAQTQKTLQDIQARYLPTGTAYSVLPELPEQIAGAKGYRMPPREVITTELKRLAPVAQEEAAAEAEYTGLSEQIQDLINQRDELNQEFKLLNRSLEKEKAKKTKADASKIAALTAALEKNTEKSAEIQKTIDDLRQKATEVQPTTLVPAATLSPHGVPIPAGMKGVMTTEISPYSARFRERALQQRLIDTLRLSPAERRSVDIEMSRITPEFAAQYLSGKRVGLAEEREARLARAEAARAERERQKDILNLQNTVDNDIRELFMDYEKIKKATKDFKLVPDDVVAAQIRMLNMRKQAIINKISQLPPEVRDTYRDMFELAIPEQKTALGVLAAGYEKLQRLANFLSNTILTEEGARFPVTDIAREGEVKKTPDNQYVLVIGNNRYRISDKTAGIILREQQKGKK